MAVTGILGKKIGMTQVFDEKGDVHPITVLQAGPCVITQLKTLARDGYDSAQIGLIEFVKGSRVNKAQAGHFAKNNVPPVKLIKEVPVEVVVATGAVSEEGSEDGNGKVKAGDKVLVDIFADDKYVDVRGTSKGRGFAGVIRRHGFGGGPKVARTYVSGAGLDRRIVLPVPRLPGAENAVGTWVRRRSRSAIFAFAALIWTRTC